jgi:hypothetical protein
MKTNWIPLTLLALALGTALFAVSGCKESERDFEKDPAK